MSAALKPVTRQRLMQFRRRWQTLELTKGLAVASLLGLACLLVVIIVDASLVVPGPVRWLLSGTIYAVLLAGLGRIWQRVGRGQGLTVTAQQFEAFDPRLREHLVSAVELSEDTVANTLASRSFRERLQAQVAGLIAPVRVAELLPWSSIARGVIAAAGGWALLVGLAWVPGLHWSQRVGRALLPGANLGRISRFDVTILQPSPASTLLPVGSVVAIEASVSGPLPESVMLETRRAGQVDALAMRGIARGPLATPTASQATATELQAENLVYTANLTIDDQRLEYRVVAEDAHTPWYELTSRARPTVEGFAMRIVHPAYAQLPDKLLESHAGDLEALRGSRVSWQLVCNQPISQAWLSVSLPESPEPTKIHLKPLSVQAQGAAGAQLPDTDGLAGRVFEAEMPIDSDFTYRVHLEAAETRFTNAFSRQYQVRALVDDAPQLVWLEPEASLLVVEPNQLVRLELEARDELPIGQAWLISSLNGENAATATIDLARSAELQAQSPASPAEQKPASEPEPAMAALVRTPILQELDLLKLQVHVGDMLRVAVQVKDRAGQVALAAPLELMVSTAGVAPERRPATAQRMELAAELRKFAGQVQPQIKQIRQLHQALQEQEQLPADQRTASWEQIQEAGAQLAQQARDNAAQLREKVAAGLSQPQDSVSLSEFERTGQVLARIQSQLSAELAATTKILDISSNSPEQLAEQLNKVRNATERLGDLISLIDRRFREFVAYDLLSEVARGMRVIQDYQQQLVAGAAEESPAQLKRRQAVVARQLRDLEQVMIDRSPWLHEQGAPGLPGWSEWASQMAERIERAAADPDDNPNFKEFSQQILVEVRQHQTVMSVDGGLDSEILKGWRELDAASDSSATTLGQLSLMVAEAARQSDGQLSPGQRDQCTRELQMLQHRKELHQARGDADAYHVSDAGNALRAVRNLIDRAADRFTLQHAQQMQATSRALKKLEAVYDFNQADKHLADLEQTERWNSSSVEAQTESPRTWDAWKHRLEQAARALREAGVDGNVADQVERLRDEAPASQAGQKIQARRWSPDAAPSAEAELTQIRAQLNTVKEQLDAIARAARGDLMEVAPTVSVLARTAADKVQQLQHETEKLAKLAAEDEVPDLRSSVKELEARQQQAGRWIDELREALAEMAGTQDLLDDAERATARDADTSQQIIDQASRQLSETLKPVKDALTGNAAQAPLEKAMATQGEARQALRQIAEHFAKLLSSNVLDAELADSRQALKEIASEMELAAMDEYYKAAETLSNLAGGEPQQVLKRLEAELRRNVRMREELSSIAKKTVDESVKSLAFSAEEELALQWQLEQSDPAYAARTQLLQQDIQAAGERMHHWLQQLSSEAQIVSGLAGAREQQQQLHQLHQQLQQTSAQTIAQTSAAHSSLPLEHLQRLADGVIGSLEEAQRQFKSVAHELRDAGRPPVQAGEPELKGRQREMEEWERRVWHQQARAAQAIERSHEQRLRQADNAARNAESWQRNAERARDEIAKQLEANPDSLDLKQRLLESQRQVYRMSHEAGVARGRQATLRERLATVQRTQQELTARKPVELTSQDPAVELARRLTEGASATSAAIAAELKKSLGDTAWMQELAAAQGPLQAGQDQQSRVEQSVQGVANNLQRASRHQQRLDHPQAAERIAGQAARVESSRRTEVHGALEQLAAAARQAKQTAIAYASSGEAKESASPADSLAARGAVNAAESELRQRVHDLKQMLEESAPEEAGAANGQPHPAPSPPSVPLAPQMLARMLDELDRQLSDAESDLQQPSEAAEKQPSAPSEASQAADDNKPPSSQPSSPSGQKKNSHTPSVQEAAQQLSQQLNRGRSQGRPSTAASRQAGNTADTKAAAPSPVRVLSVDRRSGEDWGKLRQQSAEQTLESARQTIAPEYRTSVETYFRVLSERGNQALDRPAQDGAKK